jgi:capsule biosynthesis phosphatase
MIPAMKRLIVDLDGTLTLECPNTAYRDKLPNLPLISRLREMKLQGFEIVIATARNMRTYEANIGLINAHTLPVIIEWLNKHQVPYDEIYVGKPWCGHDGFYIDDKAVRPSEFVSNTYPQILEILKAETRI